MAPLVCSPEDTKEIGMALETKRSGALGLRLIVGLALLGWPRVGFAQGTWSVISLPQKSGEIGEPSSLAVDAAGNLYVASYLRGQIVKRDAQGNWTVITSGSYHRLAVDTAGNLYIAYLEQSGSLILKRDAHGSWSEIAGYGKAIGQVGHVSDLAVDAAGNLYIADSGRIQKRDAQGRWSLLDSDHSGLLAVDAAGNLYVAEGYELDSRIQKRDAQGNWSVIATSGAAPGQVSNSNDLAVDATGNLYVAEGYRSWWNTGVNRIQKRDAQGNWFVIATDGADLGEVTFPLALALASAGDLYVGDLGGNDGRIQRRDARGSWSVIATDGWDTGQIRSPSALAVDTTGNLYVADEASYNWGGYRVQKRDTEGNWSMIATDGWNPGQVGHVTGLALDGAGNLYVADRGDRDIGDSGKGRILKRDAQGNWSVVATYGSDLGQVQDYPSALAVDTMGNLYVADSYDHDAFVSQNRVQKRDAQGNWSLIATEGGEVGQVSYPTALAVDTAGNLYVADTYSSPPNSRRPRSTSRIQKRNAQGDWSVIATDGAEVGQVHLPTALAVDTAGSLYVAEPGLDGISARIQKRDAQGNWSVIATYGSLLGQVDFTYGAGLAVDGAGNLYVADGGNNRVLKYTPAP
jgi:sugar lactone lactonase YvrE